MIRNTVFCSFIVVALPIVAALSANSLADDDFSNLQMDGSNTQYMMLSMADIQQLQTLCNEIFSD